MILVFYLFTFGCLFIPAKVQIPFQIFKLNYLPLHPDEEYRKYSRCSVTGGWNSVLREGCRKDRDYRGRDLLQYRNDWLPGNFYRSVVLRARSEERRVGEEYGSTSRSRWGPNT